MNIVIRLLPKRSRVSRRITLRKLTVAVVDPDADRISADLSGDYKVEIAVAIYVAGGDM